MFATDDEQAQIVSAFARDALARGDRLFYLADLADEDTVVDFVNEAGLDGRALLYAGAIQILPSSAMGLEEGFDGERQMAVWDQLAAQARADGFGGLAVAAEMTWALSWGVELDAVVDYEASCAPAFKSGELSALCQYDRRFFDAAFVNDVKHVHPSAYAISSGGWSVDYSRMHLDGTEPGGFSVGGEIDLANVAFLEALLRQQLGAGDATLDCSGITFVDIAACRLLLEAMRGSVAGGRLTLRNAPSILERVMSLCEWADGPE